MPRTKPYHHGSLRETLLDAAEAALRENPREDPSLRQLAALLKVSCTAPYGHFQTKEALLAAVATRGFTRLRTALERSEGRRGAKGERNRLKALARVYLEFGMAYPGLYRVMFAGEFDRDLHPDLRAASASAYAVLRETVSEGYDDPTSADAQGTSLAAWAIVHGFVSLLNARQLSNEVRVSNDLDSLADLAARTIVDQSKKAPSG